MRKLSIGLLGFGQTGSVVAKEIIADSSLNLRWVCRQKIPSNFKHASHGLGDDANYAPFVDAKNLNLDFLKTNPVDVIVDFSSHKAAQFYIHLISPWVLIGSLYLKLTLKL